MSVIGRTALVGVWLALLTVGCGGGDGPEFVTVEGTVTLDGQPVPNAMIAFRPQGAGGGGYTSSSYGGTDSDGYYYLQYSISQDGAIPGEYQVEISTYAEADEDEGVEAHPETIPARYNRQTELTATVEPGGGPYDFPLESGGDVIQPEVEQ